MSQIIYTSCISAHRQVSTQGGLTADNGAGEEVISRDRATLAGVSQPSAASAVEVRAIDGCRKAAEKGGSGVVGDRLEFALFGAGRQGVVSGAERALGEVCGGQEGRGEGR